MDNARLHAAPPTTAIIPGLIRLWDVGSVFTFCLLLYAYYLGWEAESAWRYITASGLFALLVTQTYERFSLYELDVIIRPVAYAFRAVLLFAAVFSFLTTVAFAFKASEQFSRIWAFSSGLGSLACIALGRLWVASEFENRVQEGKLARPVLIVGAGEQGEALAKSLERSKEPWHRIVGFFDDRVSRLGPSVNGYPVLGTVDDLVRFLRSQGAEQVLIALPWSARDRITEILRTLRALPVDVGLSPDLVGLDIPNGSFTREFGVPVLGVFRKPLGGWSYVLKRALDVSVSSLALLLLAPLFGLIALFIKLDNPGPVFFRQRRYGFNHTLIDMYKFRTMYVDQSDPDGELLTQPGDDRITGVGVFLRRTSLDELPQFFNVLRGEMSIVGPRPHAVKAKAAGELYELAVEEYAIRHKVLPGITGWAQVNGWRGETDTIDKIVKRVEHDLYYIENWSILFDLRIMLQTVWTAVGGKNAY